MDLRCVRRPSLLETTTELPLVFYASILIWELPQDAKGALGHGKGTGGLEGQSSEMFVQNLDDLLLSVTCRIRDQIYADESISARNKTKEIVKALDQEGLFEVKNSVSRIAKILNLSRDVVYLHLRSYRAK